MLASPELRRDWRWLALAPLASGPVGVNASVDWDGLERLDSLVRRRPVVLTGDDCGDGGRGGRGDEACRRLLPVSEARLPCLEVRLDSVGLGGLPTVCASCCARAVCMTMIAAICCRLCAHTRSCGGSGWVGEVEWGGGGRPKWAWVAGPPITDLPVEGDELLQVGVREYLRGEIGRALLPQVLERHAAVRRRRLMHEDEPLILALGRRERLDLAQAVERLKVALGEEEQHRGRFGHVGLELGDVLAG